MAYCFSPTSDLIWVMSELWANDDRSSYDKHPASTPYRRKEAGVLKKGQQARVGAGQVGEIGLSK
jgi:hypothetical protein